MASAAETMAVAASLLVQNLVATPKPSELLSLAFQAGTASEMPWEGSRTDGTDAPPVEELPPSAASAVPCFGKALQFAASDVLEQCLAVL